METRHRPYYCYISKGVPTVVEDRPDNFKDLPYFYQAQCPNIEIAKLAYQTNLKIMQWRDIEN